MPNLNTGKDKYHTVVNVMYAPGTFQKNGQSISVTSQAAVEALIKDGWVRTAD